MIYISAVKSINRALCLRYQLVRGARLLICDQIIQYSSGGSVAAVVEEMAWVCHERNVIPSLECDMTSESQTGPVDQFTSWLRKLLSRKEDGKWRQFDQFSLLQRCPHQSIDQYFQSRSHRINCQLMKHFNFSFFFLKLNISKNTLIKYFDLEPSWNCGLGSWFLKKKIPYSK